MNAKSNCLVSPWITLCILTLLMASGAFADDAVQIDTKGMEFSDTDVSGENDGNVLMKRSAKQLVIAGKAALAVGKTMLEFGIDPVEFAVDLKKNPGQYRVQVPEHERKRIIMLTPDDCERICVECLEHYDNEGVFYQDAAAERRVRAIAERIIAVLPEPIPLRIRLAADDSINAACLIGGALFVNRGTLNAIHDDNVLAAIIAHEYGHAVSRHSAEGLTKVVMKSGLDTYASENLAAMTNANAKSHEMIAAACGFGSELGFSLPYSRTMEFEADRLGAIYMKRAGFDPQGAVRLFEYFLSLKGDDSASPLYALLSTHPDTKQRLERIQALIPELD